MRMAKYLRRPVFEIKTYPESELEYWSLYFSIEDNQDKIIKPPQSLADCKSAVREIWK